MELSRHAPAPARYTGIGIVIAVHVVAITALMLAFVKPEAKHQDPIRVVPLPKTQEPPPPTEPPVVVKKPTLSEVPVPPVLPFPTWNDAPTITPPPLSRNGAPSIDGPVTTEAPPVTLPPLVKTPPQVLTPGAVCSVMPTPEVPPVNWAGEAVLQVVATVQGGRVVGSEFRVTQGALDAKSRRALQRSVESALAGYQCQGDAKFQQDFAFRLE